MDWQYSAADVCGALTWAFLRATRKNPSAKHTSVLGHRVAQDGWELKGLMTDNGSEFRAQEFEWAVSGTGAKHLLDPRWPGRRAAVPLSARSHPCHAAIANLLHRRASPVNDLHDVRVWKPSCPSR